ncbi:MAG: ADP-ribosylglycohydrolase family protein [Gemmatimonadota bacterium]|nr:ADP-ribosylglycohydrolase family protein [Gemmatimonadota bacterium]
MSSSSPAPRSLQDRFRGALLGTLAGDALGMPVEGWPAEEIRRELGEVREMLPARLGAGTFTDDTQMCCALAEALVESEDPARPDLDLIARRFAERFDPERGYGGNTAKLLTAIRAGAPWREVVAEHRLPGGSFANGAAMRVAPAALACYPDAEAVVRLAELQAEVTGHEHPEGRFGARLQAAGVLTCLGSASDANAGAPSASEILEVASTGWDGGIPAPFPDCIAWIGAHPDAAPEAAARALGTSVRASEAVPAALHAFLAHPDDAEEATVTAVAMGGDTDTIGAMAGALAGARNGAASLPPRWMDVLEDGPCGKDGLTELADRFYRRNHAARSGPDTR